MGASFPHEEGDPFMATFGLLVNRMGGGGDAGQIFPASDADDMSRGARFIPGEVTDERRAGRTVRFVRDCTSACCWYWQLENGDRIYHWDPLTYESIGRLNNGDNWTRETGPAGACPNCGNEHTSGGTITAAGQSSS